VPAGEINRTVGRNPATAPAQNPNGAGKHPWGLPALITAEQDRAGRSMAAHKVRRH